MNIAGKTIKAIKPIKDDNQEGFKLIFTDGTFCEFVGEGSERHHWINSYPTQTLSILYAKHS